MRLSGQRTSCKKLLIFLGFGCLFTSHPSLLHSSDLPVRTINIRIASDEEYQSRYLWDMKIFGLIHECSQRFEKKFGIRFKIKNFSYWKPLKGMKCIEDYYNALMKNVSSEECEIVIGIISPKYMQKFTPGISNYCNRYVLTKYCEPKKVLGVKHDIDVFVNKTRNYSNPDNEFKMIILHELCHMFGATDLNEKGSVMDTAEIGPQIDDFTHHVIMANRNRSFMDETFPLPSVKIDEVIRIFRDRCSLNRNEPKVIGFLVNLLLEKGDYEAAIFECQKGLEKDSLECELLSLLGQAYRKAGILDKAVSEYQKALTLKPMHSDLHYNLGVVYFDMGLAHMAIKEFRKAIDLNPDCAMFHYNLGVTFAGKNMMESAITEFHKAIELRADYHKAYTNLAESYLHRGNVEEGIGALKRALDLNPSDAYAYSNLGWAYLMKGLRKDAEKYCWKAVNLDPTLPQPHNFLGTIYASQGNNEAAFCEYRKAVDLKSDYSEAHFNLAELYLKLNDLYLSVFHFKRVVEIDPHHVSALLSLADLHFSQKKYSKAWQYVVEAEISGAEVRTEFKIKVLNKLGVKGPNTE